MEIHPGDIVAGKYRVGAILGRSRGLLLDASHTEFEQRVAVRLISPHLSDEKEVERFRREARTLSKLESEHVARIIDVGTHTDGSFFLVRQYLEGTTLARHLRSVGPLRLEEAVLYVLQAGEAVQETHSHGIIVRELSPDHLFLTTRRGGSPLVKIIEFGTAKLLREPRGGGEATATVMFGMSPYSAPEIVRRARGVDERADVWSLGAIFYELITARAPFRGDLAELMLAIARDEPTPPTQLRPDLPPELDQILAWALCKDPGGRFASVYALAHALRPFAPPEGQVLVDRIGLLAHTPAEPAPAPPQSFSPTSPLSRPGARPGARVVATSDDDVPPFSAPGATTEPLAESPLERTKFLGDMGFEAPVPLPVPRFADGSEAASASVVAAPAASPAAPAASAVARAASSSARGAAVVATTRIARPGRPVAVGAAVPALATGAHAAIEGSQTQLRQRKLAMAAIVASLVILPVLVVIVFFALQGSGASAGPAASHPSETTAAAAHAPSGTTSPVPATRETAPPPVRLTDEPPDPPPASASSSAPAPPPPTTAPPKTATTTPKTAPPPPPPPATDELGTIVVVVVGSSCAIAVDGKSHGVGASANVKVPAGAHTVTCKPSGGAMKSKSVTVKAGKSSMAMFKL